MAARAGTSLTGTCQLRVQDDVRPRAINENLPQSVTVWHIDVDLRVWSTILGPKYTIERNSDVHLFIE